VFAGFGMFKLAVPPPLFALAIPTGLIPLTTDTGTAESDVVPSPSTLAPQLFTLPSESTTALVPIIETAPFIPVTATGVELSVVVPLPSRPPEFHPQHFAVPSESMAQLLE